MSELIILLAIILLAGCAQAGQTEQTKHGKGRFVDVYFESPIIVIQDTKTGVCLVYRAVNNGGGLTTVPSEVCEK